MSSELVLQELLMLTKELHSLNEINEEDRMERAERHQKRIKRQRDLQKSIIDHQNERISKLEEEKAKNQEDKSKWRDKYREESQESNRLKVEFQKEKEKKDQCIKQLDELNELKLHAEASLVDNELESHKLELENASKTRQNEYLQTKSENQQKAIKTKENIIDSKDSDIRELNKTYEGKVQALESLNEKYIQKSYECGEAKAKLEDANMKKTRLERQVNIQECDKNIWSNDLKNTTSKLAITEVNLAKTKKDKQALEEKSNDQKEEINNLQKENNEMSYYKDKQYEYRTQEFSDRNDITEEKYFLFWNWTSTVGCEKHKLIIKEKRLYLGKDEKGKPKYGEWEIYYHDNYVYKKG